MHVVSQVMLYLWLWSFYIIMSCNGWRCIKRYIVQHWCIDLVTVKSAENVQYVTWFGLWGGVNILRSNFPVCVCLSVCVWVRGREREICSSWFAQQLRKHMTAVSGIHTWLVQGNETQHIKLSNRPVCKETELFFVLIMLFLVYRQLVVRLWLAMTSQESICN